MTQPLEPLTRREARRLALARAGLLDRRWSGLPTRASGAGRRARRAAHSVIRRFGYLQLDTVSIAGARSHALVLLSRLEGFDPDLAEELLQPGEPLFEYWGHEASWIPLELYPVFAFRREEFAVHPWWGDLLGEHPEVADRILERIRSEGPLRSVDLEGASRAGWWNLKLTKKVATALWSRGDLAIRERRGFQRSFDLAERVIPHELRARSLPRAEAFKLLLLRALAGHGWARTGTLAATWRLRNCGVEIRQALEELREEGQVAACEVLLGEAGKDRSRAPGWIRPRDRELAARLRRLRPRRDRGVLLSPFDPVLWDRKRVAELFGFEQLLEIFKPREQRKYGYYCLPVLAGERLVGRVDLKAERGSPASRAASGPSAAGTVRVLSTYVEPPFEGDEEAERAMRIALHRHAATLSMRLEPDAWSWGEAG